MAPKSSPPSPFNFSHLFTPVRDPDDVSTVSSTPKKRPEQNDDVSVSWLKCRPVLPIENSSHKTTSSMASPNKIFKSIVSTLSRKSPRPSEISPAATEEHYRIAVAELTRRLVEATRRRDEALLETSRLKKSMYEFESKLTNLELYCHSLNTTPFRQNHNHDHQFLVDRFLVSVSEARSAVRILTRSLFTLQHHHTGSKMHQRVAALLQPYDLEIKSARSVMCGLEALLNRALFDGFETGFRKNPANPILNPVQICDSNFALYGVVSELTWEEVLEKGTRQFCDRFSRFCDEKMSEVVGILGLDRAWTEPLLQAFFKACRGVWMVHLLAGSVHPGLPVFRVDKGMRFDPVYMEDVGADRGRAPVPSVVRVMVAPGFYVFGNVVKCKVMCKYKDDKCCNENGLVDNLN